MPEEPKQCPNCPTVYDPIYLVCPECGYPAQDLALFEGDDRELDQARQDCADNKHDFTQIFNVIGVATIDGCSLCGVVRVRLLRQDRTFFLKYRPEFRRFDRQT
jgi:hypothetical protein